MSAIMRFFKPGQSLFHEGDPSRSMFLIKKGTVAIRKKKGAAFVEIAKIYSNEVIGELSFFDRLPRSAEAVALTEVETLEIQFEALDKVYTNVPDYMKTIIASLADRLRKANDMIRRLQKNTIARSAESEADANAADALAATVGLPMEDSSSFDDALNRAVAESAVDGSSDAEIDAEIEAEIDAELKHSEKTQKKS